MAKTITTNRKRSRARPQLQQRPERPQAGRKPGRRGPGNRTAARKAAPQFLPALPENESEDQYGAYGDGRGETDLLQP